GPPTDREFSQKTIFDLLDEHGVSWKYYTDDVGYLQLFIPLYRKSAAKMAKIAQYELDLSTHHLPQVAFLDARWDGEAEHPNANIQVGQNWVKARLTSLQRSSAWSSSAFFLTYDENGGFFDHVPPPPACLPDSKEPVLPEGSVAARFDRYGFRVPLIAVS